MLHDITYYTMIQLVFEKQKEVMQQEDEWFGTYHIQITYISSCIEIYTHLHSLTVLGTMCSLTRVILLNYSSICLHMVSKLKKKNSVLCSATYVIFNSSKNIQYYGINFYSRNLKGSVAVGVGWKYGCRTSWEMILNFNGFLKLGSFCHSCTLKILSKNWREVKAVLK